MQSFRRGALMLALTLLLTACQYVDSVNIYPDLSDSDHSLLYNSDSALTYQMDFTGALSIRLESTGEEIVTQLSGEGGLSSVEDEPVPNMRFIVNFESTTGARTAAATMEILAVDGIFYQRITSPDLPETPWQQTTLTEMASSYGVPIPAAGEDVPDQLLGIFNDIEGSLLSSYADITRQADASVNGEESAVFNIQVDGREALSAPALNSLMLAQLPPDVVASLSPEEQEALIAESINQSFAELSIQVLQYVNISTGNQNRSTTRIVWAIDVPTADAATLPADADIPTERLTVTFDLDTYYRDYDEPYPIEAPAPEDIVVLDIAAPLPSAQDEVIIQPPTRDAAEINASFSPTSLSGEVCNAACITAPITIQLPPLDRPPARLDLAFVMDNSGSMEGEINAVRASIQNIANALRAEVPDTRFAYATFAEHPDFDDSAPGDLPYDVISPFTDDLAAFEASLDTVQLMDGGGGPEASLYALVQASTTLDWRPDTVRVIAFFTDAPPHTVDPGADAELDTADDLRLRAAIQALQAENIIVVGIGSRTIASVEDFLEDLAQGTGGVFVPLSDASEIPAVLVEQVSGLVSGELVLTPSQLSFASASDEWLVSSPTSFEYPTDGAPVTLEMQICPQQANLSDGDYSIALSLTDSVNSFGTLPVNFRYDVVCADVFIADTPTDSGGRCSDVGGAVFWDSPEIVVRRAADGGMITQFPIPNQENYVYVRVSNAGPQAADAAQVALYTAPTLFNDTFPGSANPHQWSLVGQESVTLAAGEQRWVGPFRWTPTSEQVTLYASVSTAEDTLRRPDDIACENNAALSSRIPVVLDNPSYGPNLMAGSLPLTLLSSLTYDTLDLDFNLSTLNGTGSFVALDLNQETYTNWRDSSAVVAGGEILPSGRIESFPGARSLLLGQLVGGPTVQADLNLLLAASRAQGEGFIGVGLNASDRTVTGASIYYTIDRSVLPTDAPDTPDSALERATSGGLPFWVPGVLAAGLLVLWLLLRSGK